MISISGFFATSSPQYLYEGKNLMYTCILNENSRSGKGKEVWQAVEQVLKSRRIPYTCYKTEYEGHACRLAEQLTGAGENTDSERINLLVIGGDGTINEVLDGIRDFSRIRLGVIPVGSGNDFAREFPLSKDPVSCITHILDHGEELCVDLGEISWDQGRQHRLFAISSGIGLDAIVCKKALTSHLKVILNKLHLGKLTYVLLTVQTLFSMKTANVSLTLEDGSCQNLDRMIFLAAMNFRAEGGGVPMAPHADHTDGCLDLCTAFGIPKWKTFFLLPLLILGKHEHISGIRVIRCKSCKIRTDQPMIVHADGEYCGTLQEIEVSCHKKILTLIR
jgi:YegS/Rv2252/BmrU family lipid kinase